MTSGTAPREAIILAGGYGTRLQSILPDTAKSLAPIAGEPFLTFLIRKLLQQGITRFVFALGYRHLDVHKFVSRRFPYLDAEFVIEESPLGTGGAIRIALAAARTDNVLVVNGDTYFDIDLETVVQAQLALDPECMLVVTSVENANRYGTVSIAENGWISGFREKADTGAGIINTGMYLLRKDAFLQHRFPPAFSFEKEYLQRLVGENRFAAMQQAGYFIDIGVPEDYKKAQTDLPPRELLLSEIDADWTLFLDRDGVINHDKVGSYIFNPREFSFYDAAPAAVAHLGRKFGRIIVVTNQRGVGRGLMTENDLKAIHAKMLSGMKEAGATIDKIYYCTATVNQDPYRKPMPGMALQAVQDFPEIDLHKSVMVGNNLSDMQFGRNAGMHTVYLTTTNPPENLPHPDIDKQYPLLTDFAKEM